MSLSSSGESEPAEWFMNEVNLEVATVDAAPDMANVKTGGEGEGEVSKK